MPVWVPVRALVPGFQVTLISLPRGKADRGRGGKRHLHLHHIVFTGGRDAGQGSEPGAAVMQASLPAVPQVRRHGPKQMRPHPVVTKAFVTGGSGGLKSDLAVGALLRKSRMILTRQIGMRGLDHLLELVGAGDVPPQAVVHIMGDFVVRPNLCRHHIARHIINFGPYGTGQGRKGHMVDIKRRAAPVIRSKCQGTGGPGEGDGRW